MLKERWELNEKKMERVSECVDVCVCAGSLPDSHEMPRASN